MRAYPVPENERARVEALHALDLIGGSRHAELDSMVALACRMLKVPVALVTLIDDDRQWFKASEGTDFRSLERESAFCNYAITSGELFVVHDASQDRRFDCNRVVRDEPGFRFYAGMPLALEPGLHVGTLCVLDTKPRRLTVEDERLLCQMADVVTAVIRQGRDARTVARFAQDLERQVRLNREQATSLADSRKIFDRASALAKIGVWQCELKDETLHWTDGVYDLFELPRGSAITRAQILELYYPDYRDQLDALRSQAIRERSGFHLDAKIVTAKGNKRWMRLTANVECENGVAVRIFGMKQDITEERALLDRTRFLAECDVLTGLANRSLFQTRLAGLPESRAEPDPVGALLLVDLDGFKQINDTFGHSVGDECLKELASRLRHVCREAELVARIGGDEFAILIAPGFDRQAIEDHANQILGELRRTIRWREQSFQLSASIGVAIPVEAAGHGSSQLFTEADLALYAAKAAGRNTFRTFTPDMKSKSDARFNIVRNITRALAEEQLDLFYQPKVRLLEHNLAGFEALLRWRVPGGAVMTARSFEAAFEDPDLSGRLGQWVIRKALRQAEHWNRIGFDFGHIAINVSSTQLRDHRFGDSLIGQIAAHGLRTDMIEVEVTEGVFLSQETDLVRRILERLKNEGVRIALDDFGTGYASLVHLRTYPIDVIKIDRSFVQHFLTSAQDRAILEATLSLGLRLGMDIVAEGIETPDQLDILRQLGCQYGQGFLFSKPVPAAEAEKWQRPAPAEAYPSARGRPDRHRAA